MRLHWTIPIIAEKVQKVKCREWAGMSSTTLWRLQEFLSTSNPQLLILKTFFGMSLKSLQIRPYRNGKKLYVKSCNYQTRFQINTQHSSQSQPNLPSWPKVPLSVTRGAACIESQCDFEVNPVRRSFAHLAALARGTSRVTLCTWGPTVASLQIFFSSLNNIGSMEKLWSWMRLYPVSSGLR